MEKTWKGKNVSLDLFTTYIGEFFKTRDFEAVRGEIPTGYQIFAADSPHCKLEGYVNVSIEGKPEDFTVKIDLCSKEKKGAFRPPTFLVTMFTGGYFFLRKFRSDEAWMNLEREFWHHVENAILHLTGSAGDAAPVSE